MEPSTGKRLCQDSNRVGRWVAERLDADWIPGAAQAIGLLENEELIAGVIFEGYNGASIRMHVAAVPGRRWLNRQYLHACFWYVFEQLGCKAAIGLVPESNAEARRFDEHLGFRAQVILEDCHPDGGLVVYTMTRDQCKWLSLRTSHGQAESTSPA